MPHHENPKASSPTLHTQSWWAPIKTEGKGRPENSGFPEKRVPEKPGSMSLWWLNGVFVTLTHVVAILALFYQVRTSSVYAFMGVIPLSMLGITAGYHRLWSHRSYVANFPLRVLLMVLGTLGFQGSIRWWVLRHRIHHRFTDSEDDPYTIKKGFFFAHIGWIFQKPLYRKMSLIDSTDLDADRVVTFQHKNYVPLALFFGFFLPTVFGALLGDAVGGFLYGGVFPRVLIWHATFCINSVAHWIGEREFAPNITAAGGLFVSLITNGEGYHNFHHVFPKDYRNGVRWYDFDPTKWFISFCWYLGLATDLIKTSEENIEKLKVQALEEKIHNKKQLLNWGPTEAELPGISLQEYQKRAQEGGELLLLNDFVVDVGGFKASHPGGEKILKSYYGKDASQAFNGGMNIHTPAAIALSKMMRVAKLERKSS